MKNKMSDSGSGWNKFLFSYLEIFRQKIEEKGKFKSNYLKWDYVDRENFHTICMFLSSIKNLKNVVWKANLVVFEENFIKLSEFIFSQYTCVFNQITQLDIQVFFDVNTLLSNLINVESLKLRIRDSNHVPIVKMAKMRKLHIFLNVTDLDFVENLTAFVDENHIVELSFKLTCYDYFTYLISKFNPLIDVLSKKLTLQSLKYGLPTIYEPLFLDIVSRNLNIITLKTFDCGPEMTRVICKSNVKNYVCRIMQKNVLNSLTKAKNLVRIRAKGKLVGLSFEEFLHNTTIIELPCSYIYDLYGRAEKLSGNEMRNFILKRNKTIWSNIGLVCGTIKVLHANYKRSAWGKIQIEIVQIICSLIRETHNEVLVWCDVFRNNY